MKIVNKKTEVCRLREVVTEAGARLLMVIVWAAAFTVARH